LTVAYAPASEPGRCAAQMLPYLEIFVMDRVAFLLAVLAASPSTLGQEEVKLTRTQVLKAIEIFGAEPLSDRGGAMASGIVTFADDSKDVVVRIGPDLYPWLVSEPSVKYKGELLTALIAGNVRSQLETGVVRSDAYSGMLFLFRIYSHLKANDKSFSITEIEEQIKVHGQGKLHAYIVEHQTPDDSVQDPLNP
jgi:hypothetical protein